MATQICPNCKSDSFTWTLDEAVSLLTRWGCYECGYYAYEDETLERECSNCKRKTDSRLGDEHKTYWWCSSCYEVT